MYKPTSIIKLSLWKRQYDNIPVVSDLLQWGDNVQWLRRLMGGNRE